MTDEYIDKHFDEIKDHAYDIESRLDDSSCTIQSLKSDNQTYIQGCQEHGEQVTLIATNYNRTMQEILDRF